MRIAYLSATEFFAEVSSIINGFYRCLLERKRGKWTVWLSSEGLVATHQDVEAGRRARWQVEEGCRTSLQESLRLSNVELEDEGDIALHEVIFFAWTTRMLGMELRVVVA